MLFDSSFPAILFPVIALAVIISLVAHFLFVRGKSGLEKDLAWVRNTIVIAGCLMLFLWFSLPSTPVLGSFGYPKTVADIEDPAKLLKLLQDYNEALVRTTSILHWFIFISVFLVLEPLYRMTRSLRSFSRES